MPTTEALTPSHALPSVYNEHEFSKEDFQIELDRVYQETAIERQWIQDAALPTYATDADILHAASKGKLERVAIGVGFWAIDRLLYWDTSRSDPHHEWHYSVPYLRPEAYEVLMHISGRWQEDMGGNRYTSVTSVGRSDQYMDGLKQRPRKLTIVAPDAISSHQALISIDFDGIGLVEVADDGTVRKINPRSPDWNPVLAAESRDVLRHLLLEQQRRGIINFVEELPGTQEHCFHVCVNPTL